MHVSHDFHFVGTDDFIVRMNGCGCMELELRISKGSVALDCKGAVLISSPSFKVDATFITKFQRTPCLKKAVMQLLTKPRCAQTPSNGLYSFLRNS